MTHTHYINSIEYRAKDDSIIGKCSCGKEEIFALWWKEPPSGWNRKQWPMVRGLANQFIESCKSAIDDGFTYEQLENNLPEANNG